MKRLIKPAKLKYGDKVAIVSLSSGILGEPATKHQVNLGIKRLNKLGLEAVFMPHSLKGLDFILNNPEARASDLKEAFKDESIKGIICAIGGDDTYKTIPYLMEDNEFITLVKNNPKVFIGFSDSTNNHIMLNKLGLTTYYGLNFLSDLCELDKDMLEYTKEAYQRFFINKEKYLINGSTYWFENRTSYDDSQIDTKLKKHLETKGYEYLNGTDKVVGRLWGGCLESIYDIYTSERYKDQRAIYDKYDLIPNLDFFKDKILFLETSEEIPTPKKFLEMFNFLSDEGILSNIKGLLVGKPYDEIYYDEYRDILLEISHKHNLGVVYNMNFGHALPRTMIPYGVKCEIDFNKETVSIIEKTFED